VQSSSMNTTVVSRVARSTTTSTTTTSTTRRPPPYSISVIEKKGCRVGGRFYEVGQRIKSASNACLDCRCDHKGLMQCNPLVSHLVVNLSLFDLLLIHNFSSSSSSSRTAPLKGPYCCA